MQKCRDLEVKRIKFPLLGFDNSVTEWVEYLTTNTIWHQMYLSRSIIIMSHPLDLYYVPFMIEKILSMKIA